MVLVNYHPVSHKRFLNLKNNDCSLNQVKINTLVIATNGTKHAVGWGINLIEN